MQQEKELVQNDYPNLASMAEGESIDWEVKQNDYPNLASIAERESINCEVSIPSSK